MNVKFEYKPQSFYLVMWIVTFIKEKCILSQKRLKNTNCHYFQEQFP